MTGLLLRGAVVSWIFFVGCSLSESVDAEHLARIAAEYKRGQATEDVPAARELFRKAGQEYTALIEKGFINGTLYLNAAVAYHSAEDYGEAAVHYRMAKRFMPGSPDLLKNYTMLRERLAASGVVYSESADEADVVTDVLLFWHGVFSWRTTYILALLAAMASLVGLGLHAWRPDPRWLWSGILAGLVAFAFWGSILYHAVEGMRDIGAVAKDAAVLRVGPGDHYPSALESSQAETYVPPGTEFWVVESHDDAWVQVRLRFVDVTGFFHRDYITTRSYEGFY